MQRSTKILFTRLNLNSNKSIENEKISNCIYFRISNGNLGKDFRELRIVIIGIGLYLRND
jgi:hypothetical protein